MNRTRKEPLWGPQNPHPLAAMKTELVWEGKYDDFGRRREVDLAGCAMPMQRIETIDQPRSEAAAADQLDLFEKKTRRLDDFRNRLIWGDNKLVMASLLAEFKGKIDLIYIDPPFDVGADFTMDVPIGDTGSVGKDQSALEMVAYRDTWGRGVDSYFQMMFERLCVMRELLAERGSIYVHVGPNISQPLKVILDEVFSNENYRNELVWQRHGAHNDADKYGVLGQTPSPLLHGRKNGSFCHVDGIDSIFTRPEAVELAAAVARAGGNDVYVLAWEFEMDLRLMTAALERDPGVKLKLIQIPREIMERNRKSPPPFLEMAILEAEPVIRKAGKLQAGTPVPHSQAGTPVPHSQAAAPVPQVDIKLTKFMPSLAEVPSKELDALKERALSSGFDFIDFWAVDFDWQPGKPFNHHWQDYRTRKDRSLKTVSDAAYEYRKRGAYTACVKVVDVFGCDTSVTVEGKV